MLVVLSNVGQSWKQILIYKIKIEQTNTDNSEITINDSIFVNDITGSDNSSIIIEQITPEVSN